MIDEKYRNIKLFYGIRDIFAMKRFFKQYFIPHALYIIFPYPFRILSSYSFRSAFYPLIPTCAPHYIPISIPHFIPISVPFGILSHICSVFSPYIRSVPQIRSVPHPYPHFNLSHAKSQHESTACISEQFQIRRAKLYFT